MKFVLFCSLILWQTGIFAQKTGQALVDSVLNVLPSLKDDSNKVKSLAKIGETYLYHDPAKGIDYVKSGLTISEKLGYDRGISRMQNLLGLLVGDTGNNTLSRVYFNQSYDVNKKLGFSFGMISNLNNIGRSYQRESNYSSALDYFLKALAIAEEIKNNEQIALVGTNLTASYYAQENYAKALEYAEMTLKYAQLSNSVNNIGKAFFEIGNIKEDMKDSVSAREYLDRAYQVYEKMDNKSAMAQVLVQKATLEYPDFQKAVVQMLRAQHILDSIGPSSISSIANLANLGFSYFELAIRQNGIEKNKFLNSGEAYLNRGLQICRETANTEFQANMYRTLADIKEEKGDYKSALASFKKYYSINDSLFSQDKKNRLAGLESKHKIDLKDKEIAFSKLELVSQQRALLGLLIGLILLGTIGSLLVWQNRIRKKSNTTLMALNNQLDEANKVKAKFFGILSHDLRSPISNLVNYLYLLKNEPGQLSIEERNISQQQIGQSAEELLQTMEAMLLWSKEQMDHFKPEISMIRVGFLFDYLVKFFPQSARVNIRFSDPGDLEVSADENYLKVIMQNLTSNALKAIRNDPNGFIEWKARKDGRQTILSIADNGPGTSEEQVRALYSEDAGINSKTGFGFHIIRDLAKAIHYKISIESKPGRGTTFTLSNLLYA